jgi:uncharacterized protein (TIGR02996 family)
VTTDPDYAALLRAVLADPADDVPRLILADWLDEHREPERAEFIRVQCELANHPGMNCGVMYCSRRDPGGLCDSCQRYDALRQRELLTNFRAASWAGVNLPFNDFEYRRGFVAQVNMPLDGWLSAGPNLVHTQPLERVVLTDRRPLQVGMPGRRFGWLLAESLSEPPAGPSITLPARLLPHLPPSTYENVPHDQTRRRWYKTEQEARDAASQACLAWAKEEARAAAA